jgi:arylsulfatase
VGGSDSAFFESAGPLRGLKGSVYEGGIRVPLIARWPGKVQAGTTTDLPRYFPDVMPTLMEIVGATAILPKGIDGVSLAPTLFSQSGKQVRHDHLVWEFAGYGGQQAVRLWNWKGVRRNLQKGNSPVELYNLKEDVGEQHNVAAQHPEVVRRIEKIMGTDRVPSKSFPIKVLDG